LNRSISPIQPHRKPRCWKWLDAFFSFFTFRRDGAGKVGEMFYPKYDPEMPPDATADEMIAKLSQEGVQKALPYRYKKTEHVEHILLLMKAIALKNIATFEVNNRIVSRLLEQILPPDTTLDQRKHYGIYYDKCEPDHNQVRAATRSLREVIRRQYLAQLAPWMFEVVAVGSFTTVSQHYATQILEMLGVTHEEMRKALFDVKKSFAEKPSGDSINE